MTFTACLGRAPQLLIDGGSTKSNGFVAFKPPADIADRNRFAPPGHIFNHHTTGNNFIYLIIVAISFSATATEAAGHRLGRGLNCLYSDIAQPEFEIIVGVSESVSYIAGKIINEYQVSFVPKAAAASAA